MENFDNSSFDYDNQAEEPLYEEEPPQRPSNRNFVIALVVIGGVIIFSVLAVIVFLVFIQPNSARNRASQATMIAQQNAATAVAATLSAEVEQTAMAITATFEAMPPTATSTATATPVVVFATETPIAAEGAEEATPTESTGAGGPPPEEGELTATYAAALTVQAQTTTPVVSVLTTTPGAGVVTTGTPQATALPGTGFADEVGLPTLFGMAVLLLVIVFVARRMRLSSR